MSKADEILAGMKPWFKEVEIHRAAAKTIKSRSEFQTGWDQAVLACSEFVRRMQDYDERLAIEIFKMCTPIEEQRKLRR